MVPHWRKASHLPHTRHQPLSANRRRNLQHTEKGAAPPIINYQSSILNYQLSVVRRPSSVVRRPFLRSWLHKRESPHRIPGAQPSLPICHTNQCRKRHAGCSTKSVPAPARHRLHLRHRQQLLLLRRHHTPRRQSRSGLHSRRRRQRGLHRQTSGG